MKLPFAFARRFVAGESFPQALPAIRTLTDQGLFVTLDMLGEYVSDRHVAERARDAYIELIKVTNASRNFRMEANISIKLSMLGQKIDEAFCLDNLRQLLAVAKEEDVFVRLDMEGSDITASTLGLFETVFPDYPDHVGVVLQAYLKRTADDVRRMCELKARVRICKGAYKEPADIAYQDMPTIRARYMEYARLLITEGRYPGIATHDDQLIDSVKAFVQDEGIPLDRFEFQMLYGIRPKTQLQLRSEGYNMRVYIPYGTEWVPYFNRRLRERKENIWFVVKNLFRA
ncbi:MAG: proline dehydrogenase family protein [Rhodothermales bacterium]